MLGNVDPTENVGKGLGIINDGVNLIVKMSIVAFLGAMTSFYQHLSYEKHLYPG